MAIEADHYREEVERLKGDEKIRGMAQELIDTGQALTFLDDPDAMAVTYDVAGYLGVEFDSIGGPHRAIVALLADQGYQPSA